MAKLKKILIIGLLASIGAPGEAGEYNGAASAAPASAAPMIALFKEFKGWKELREVLKDTVHIGSNLPWNRIFACELADNHNILEVCKQASDALRIVLLDTARIGVEKSSAELFNQVGIKIFNTLQEKQGQSAEVLAIWFKVLSDMWSWSEIRKKDSYDVKSIEQYVHEYVYDLGYFKRFMITEKQVTALTEEAKAIEYKKALLFLRGVLNDMVGVVDPRKLNDTVNDTAEETYQNSDNHFLMENYALFLDDCKGYMMKTFGVSLVEADEIFKDINEVAVQVEQRVAQVDAAIAQKRNAASGNQADGE